MVTDRCKNGETTQTRNSTNNSLTVMKDARSTLATIRLNPTRQHRTDHKRTKTERSQCGRGVGSRSVRKKLSPVKIVRLSSIPPSDDAKQRQTGSRSRCCLSVFVSLSQLRVLVLLSIWSALVMMALLGRRLLSSNPAFLRSFAFSRVY